MRGTSRKWQVESEHGRKIQLEEKESGTVIYYLLLRLRKHVMWPDLTLSCDVMQSRAYAQDERD